MEASLQTLPHRGFPVDRILRPVVVPPPPPPPPPQPEPLPIVETTNTKNSNVRDQAETSTNGYTSNDGFDSILSQMFPNCPLNVIQGMLGDNPSKEKAREVANELSSMDTSNSNDKPHSKMTKEDEGNSLTNGKESHRNKQLQSDPKSKKKSGGIMGKMMGGLRPGSAGGIKAPSLGKRVIQQQASEPNSNHGTPPLPQNDAASQQSLEAMLQDSVQSTRSVQSAGVSAPETLLKTLPQGLECGSEGKPIYVEHILS